MRTENELTQAAARAVRDEFRGIFYWKVTDMRTAGIPDSVFIHPNGIVFVEFKKLKIGQTIFHKGVVKDIQRITIQRLAKAGAHVIVVAFVPRPGKSGFDQLLYNANFQPLADTSLINYLHGVWG